MFGIIHLGILLGLCFVYGGIEMEEEKEEYRKEIIKIIENITDASVLEYLYYLIKGKTEKAV